VVLGQGLVVTDAAAAFADPGRWVGRAARCLLGKPFSARPPAEPDVMVSRSSGSPVIAA
jgi:hypothetical protein